MNQFLIENIANVSLSNGVVRIQCTSTGADGETQTAGELVIPAGQYSAVVQGLQNAGQQLQARQEEQKQQQEGEAQSGQQAAADADQRGDKVQSSSS